MEEPLRAFLDQGCWRPQWNMEVLAGRRFSARVIALRSGEPLILCEMARNKAWPGYFERREIRRAIGRRLRGHGLISEDPGDVDTAQTPVPEGRSLTAAEEVSASGAAGEEPPRGLSQAVLCWGAPKRAKDKEIVVFTDIAHSRYLWTWTEPAVAGFERYVELPLEPEERLARALATRAGPASAGAAGGSQVGRSVEREVKDLANSILSRFPERVRRSAGRVGLACWCLRQAEPRDVWRLWEILERVRVIDPRCGSGDWLLAMGIWLETVYIACLDRIRCHAFEPVNVCDRRLHAKWRALVDGVEAPLDGHGPALAERYLRWRIVARNLYGWDSDRRCVSHARRRLRDYAGLSRSDVEAEPNVRFCASELVEQQRNEREAFAAGREGPYSSLSDLREELRVLELAREVALEPENVGDESTAERRRSRREWERRRRALVRKLKMHPGEQPGDPAGVGGRPPAEGSGLWVNEDIRLVRRAGRRALRPVT